MFLVLGLLLGCVASVAVAGEKPFEYHDGYSDASKKYVDVLKSIHPAYSDVCNKNIHPSYKARFSSIYFPRNSSNPIQEAKRICDGAVLVFHKHKYPFSETFLQSGLYNHYNIPRMQDPVQRDLEEKKIAKELRDGLSKDGIQEQLDTIQNLYSFSNTDRY